MTVRTSLNNCLFSAAVIGAALIASSNTASAGPVRDAAGFVGNTVADTAHSVGKVIGGVSDRVTGDVNYAEVRLELDETAKTSLKGLFSSLPKSKELFDRAYGYAVFENRKTALLLSAGSGAGVAVDKKSGHRTYMHMASLGVGVGAGLEFYRSIFLFETESAFKSFITSGWEANAAADASFGKAGADAELKFNGGMAFYHISDSGAIVSARIAGTKYWVSEDLNRDLKKQG